MVTSWDLVELLNEQFHWKVLQTSFHLNGQTIRFHVQTWKLEQPCAT